MKKFEPTKDMVAAAALVMHTMAAVDVIKPIVDGYRRRILEEGQWQVKPEFRDKMSRRGGGLGEEVILDPKNAYLMSDENFAIYDAKCKAARDEAGLHVEDPEFCPLCVAEHDLVKARVLLVNAMQPITGLEYNKLLCAGLDKLDEYVNLTLKLMGPFVKEWMKDNIGEPVFIRCEPESVPVLTALGAKVNAYDVERGGVSAMVTDETRKDIARFPADFQVEELVKRPPERVDPQAKSEPGADAAAPAPGL